MKKILLACGFAIASVGLFSTASGENNGYVHTENVVVSENFQDTIPGRKRDTTNRKPLPQDTIRRDSGYVNLIVPIK